MTGIFLLLVMGIWFLLALSFSYKVSGWFFNYWKRAMVCCVMFLVMLPLPLVDEILAKNQFEALCQAHSQLIFDPQTAAGKTIYSEEPKYQNIEGAWVPMRLALWRFREVNTHKLVASYELVYASSGFLGRSLGLTQSPSPFLFDGFCVPKGYQELYTTFNKVGITQASRPKP